MINETQINDDNYDYQPDAQEQRGPAPAVLMPGVYKVQARIMRRTNDGNPVNYTDAHGNEWPVYVIPSIEVTEPFENGGRFDVWKEIETLPRRFNENDPYVSMGAVLLKAIDAQLADSASGFGDAIRLLGEKAEGGLVEFTVSTGLTAKDSDWARAEIKRLNLDPIQDKKEIRKIWNKANLPTKTFLVQKATKTTPAKYALRAKSPLSATMVEAKTMISRFLPSNMEGVTLGTGQFPPRG